MFKKLFLFGIIGISIMSCSKSDLMSDEMSPASSQQLRAAVTVFVDSDIAVNTRWSKKNLYVVRGEVHVRSGVTLTVEDGVQVIICNGHISTPSSLTRAALVFNTGSSLMAGSMTVRAGDNLGRVQNVPDNGGLWFFGSRVSNKDGFIGPIGSGISHFIATDISASYLGHPDTTEIAALDSGAVDPIDVFDDIDGISLMGLEPNECSISSLQSLVSGDDGIDVYNSNITIGSVYVTYPTEDGINITSSTVNVPLHCNVQMRRNFVRDRDIFDLELDDDGGLIPNPAAQYTMSNGCHVQLLGIFGDQVALTSADMPQPDPCDCVYYNYKHQLVLSDAVITAVGD